jgi:hypothetical protein
VGHVVQPARISYQRHLTTLRSDSPNVVTIDALRGRQQARTMAREPARKMKLMPAKPMTSTSSAQPSSTRGELSFNLEQKKSKGTGILFSNLGLCTNSRHSHYIQSPALTFAIAGPEGAGAEEQSSSLPMTAVYACRQNQISFLSL